MAKMKAYINAWSILPSDSSVGVGTATANSDAESTGRFGSALISIKTGNSSTKEYEFLDTAFRGSSFRMSTSVREFEIPDSIILNRLNNVNYVVRLKFLLIPKLSVI